MERQNLKSHARDHGDKDPSRHGTEQRCYRNCPVPSFQALLSLDRVLTCQRAVSQARQGKVAGVIVGSSALSMTGFPVLCPSKLPRDDLSDLG